MELQVFRGMGNKMNKKLKGKLQKLKKNIQKKVFPCGNEIFHGRVIFNCGNAPGCRY